MSDQVVITTNGSNPGAQQQPPWLLANLLSSNCGKDYVREALKSLLPGPFCVLQGSAGDGMANTLDSMPMLPLESMNSNIGPSRRSSVNSSLHPLEEMAEEEQEEEVCHNRNNEDIVTSEGLVAIARPHTPLDDNATTNNGISAIGRERSDSLTGGGLHYPLGERQSPIMQRRVKSLSLTSTFMQQQSTSASMSASSQQLKQHIEGRDSSSLRLPLADNQSDKSSNDDVHDPILKRRQQYNSSIASSSNNEMDYYSRIQPTVTISRRHNNNKSKTTAAAMSTTKSTAEIEAICKWQREVSQQEQSHLEERIQNVKLLLDRRLRTQERSRLRQLAEATSAAAAAVNDPNNRSGSPVALATTTSASSSVSGSSAGSNDGSGSAASRSRSSSPEVSMMGALSATTPQTIVNPIEGEGGGGGGGEDDSINQYMKSLELEMSHRSWYQKDGRLVVFHSLPYMSSSGKVVAHPLIFEKEEMGGEQQQQQPRREDDEIVTLAPGTTVMAEEAITLDSRSLKILHSMQQHRRHGRSHCTLVFLNISSPYKGYILSHIHNYPYVAPGLPVTYTNSTWLWRVTCQPDGAFIRSGLDLVTHHIGTLPYGTLCCVNKKVVNYMGLNRLEIDAFVNNDGNDDRSENDDGKAISTVTLNKLSGFISEFLNPLSGQRGNIVEQVSFPIPALYKVIHAEGAIIRAGVELSTGQIGFAPMGSVLSIIGRSYSSNPSNNCIERLRLAGGGGWISVNLNRKDNEQLVEMIGADESFDPEDPASFHFEQQKKVMAELKADDRNKVGGGGNNCIPRRRSTANLSEIGEDDQQSIPDSEGNYAAAMNDARASILSSPSRQSSTTAAVPTLFQRSGVVGAMGGLVAMDAVRESSSDKHQNDNANRCLICLSE